MDIGSVHIASKLALAPMAGVTDAAFRRLCASLGAGLTYTEMVSSKALCYHDKKTFTLLRQFFCLVQYDFFDFTVFYHIAQTIGTHVRNYKKYGLEGLNPRPKSGCPKKLSPSQEALLIETIVEKTPSGVGLEPYMTWNCKLLCLWVKREFGISFTKGGMRDMLLRLGFSYSRPTYSLARASQEKQEGFKQEFEQLKNFDSWRD